MVGEQLGGSTSVSPGSCPDFSDPGSRSIYRKEYSVERCVAFPAERMNIHNNRKQP